MEDLKNQIQNEIKSISSCVLQDIYNIRDWLSNANRDGHLCLFKYIVPSGSLKKKEINIGIELPINDYPRLPPHFIHFKKPEFSSEEIQKMGAIHQEYENEGTNWIALSRPPQEIWDYLNHSKKNLYTFFNSHLRRFWESL